MGQSMQVWRGAFFTSHAGYFLALPCMMPQHDARKKASIGFDKAEVDPCIYSIHVCMLVCTYITGAAASLCTPVVYLTFFYSRDAMLARVLAVALCLCLYASVTNRCSIETAERIGLVLACQLPSTYPVHCVIKKFGYLQNKDISIWNTAPNSGQWRWRMWAVAANFRRTRSPNRLAWSEGWRPPGAQSTFIK